MNIEDYLIYALLEATIHCIVFWGFLLLCITLMLKMICTLQDLTVTGRLSTLGVWLSTLGVQMSTLGVKTKSLSNGIFERDLKF